MGLEVRKNGRYYYRVFKRDGRTVRQYVGRETGPFGRAIEVLMKDLDRREREERESRRKASAELRERVGRLLAETATADAGLKLAAEAVLAAGGFHRHERGEWRMRRTTKTGDEPAGKPANRSPRTPAPPPEPVPYHGTPPDCPPPLVHYQPLPGWVDGADELFAAARSGDGAAQDRVRELLRESAHVRDHFGDLGRRATRVMIARAAGGDPVWAIGIEEKVKGMNEELLGPSPTLLDRLLVRRIVNAWVAVHHLELEQAINPPTRPRDRAYLEAAVGRASKRMGQAVADLARVRRLKLPPILVNVNAPPQQANQALPTAG